MAGVVSRLLPWLLPHAVYVRVQSRLQSANAPATHRELVAQNTVLRGIHSGRRAFIVCNGPSVNRQDLGRLKGEIVFTVSSGYLHPLYASIAPRYHCVPQISSPKDRDGRIAWLREMEAATGRAEIFLSATEAELVTSANLFPDRSVRYLSLSDTWENHSTKEVIDIASPVPGVQSAPIMMLMIALYMGLSPIYLLGTDHDHFRTGRYDYFYEPRLLKGTDPEVTEDGRVLTPLYQEFANLHRLWTQYRHLRLIAEANGMKIFNATAGGALDEFPRIALETVLDRSGPGSDA